MNVFKWLSDEVIRDFGLITREQLKEACEEQKTNSKPLTEILIERGYVLEEELLDYAAQYLGVPLVKLSQHEPDLLAVQAIPLSLIQRHQVLPLAQKNKRLTLAMSDPLDVLAIEDVQLASGCEVVPVLANPRELELIIRQITQVGLPGELEKAVARLQEAPEVYQTDERLNQIEDQAPELEAPVVKLVNEIIHQGFLRRASDIHIEPQENTLQIRYRIDGLLLEAMTMPISLHGSILSRLKIMANLDIAEKRLPQDGRIRVRFAEQTLDLRISTLPTVFGEKAMLRILDRRDQMLPIDNLDIRGSNRDNFEAIISRSSGLILVCGPAGSGKSTTLYAILAHLNSIHKNIITLEDPVECILPGINQVQINPRSGLDFASGLRSVLRQDPDIIMIGEIRDRETADLAIQAALTGHLVLSTIHTGRAVGAVIRLMDMGIEPYLLASSLVGVMAQRLVRRVCPECVTSVSVEPDTTERWGVDMRTARLVRGSGCTWCNQSGYWGRMAIHEVKALTADLQKLIEQQVPEAALEEAAIAQGMKPLWQDGLEKAQRGETTLEEVIRVIDLD
ncbi:MAG: type II/IV secretion system protein [Syntrophomonadaceae bacterium]|nr:type II/IV secretion system protein [Syntrophomonadaceae bacterium]